MEGWFLLLAGVGSIARSPVVGVKPDNPLASLVEEPAAEGGQRGRRINRRPPHLRKKFNQIQEFEIWFYQKVNPYSDRMESTSESVPVVFDIHKLPHT